jgi:thiamine pyrophosphate-dependent acetolactate synthase large subunit-like protein
VSATARTGAAAIAAALAAEGTEVIFGVLGDGNLQVVAHLVERHGVRYVAARHEAAAVAMADGYARATGRPGICTCTQGPGLTHTATTLVEARKARSPVVLLAGDTRRGFHDHAQDIEQAPFALATAGAFKAVGSPASLAKDVGDAFRHARVQRAPIVLDVPVDVQDAELEAPAEYVPVAASLVAAQRPVPDPERVAAVIGLLAGAERPVLIAGRGAVLSGAREALLALAERTGAAVATTLQAKGWFAGDPFDLGIAGGFSHDLAREVFSGADVVVAFGARLNRYTVAHGGLFPDARLVQVDVDPDAVGHTARADEAVLADARSAAEALLARLGPEAREGVRTPALAARLAAFDPLAGVEFARGSGVDPREAALLCDRLLPPDRVVLLGTGHFNGNPAIHVGVADPRDLVLPWGFGSIGIALPMALGVAVARPDRTTVVFEGDGGLMSCLPELETAAREGIRVLVIALDDGGYGAEVHMMRKLGMDDTLSRFANPDLAAVARSLGVRAFDAPDAAALEAALRDARPVERPTLIRVGLDPEVWHEEVFRALTG